MSKKTFQFDAISKKFDAQCNMAEKEYRTTCPVIKVYSAGLDTVLSASAHDVNNISVRLADAASVETVKTMFGIGQSVCKCCRFNAAKGKVK